MKSRLLLLVFLGSFLLLNASSADARERFSNHRNNDRQHNSHRNHDRNNDRHSNHGNKGGGNHGPAAPEPISSALFALGAGAVALKKFGGNK